MGIQKSCIKEKSPEFSLKIKISLLIFLVFRQNIQHKTTTCCRRLKLLNTGLYVSSYARAILLKCGALVRDKNTCLERANI